MQQAGNCCSLKALLVALAFRRHLCTATRDGSIPPPAPRVAAPRAVSPGQALHSGCHPEPCLPHSPQLPGCSSYSAVSKG